MRALLLAVGCLLFVGCKDATKDLEKLADRACECKDLACGTKVVQDLATFATNNKDARGDESRATRAGERLGECLIKAGVKPEDLMAALKPFME